MATTTSSKVPYFPRNPYIPPLSPDHVDTIFANHIQTCFSLPFSIASYLRQLAYLHYRHLKKINKELPYELDSRDLLMQFLGQDAPLSIIIATCYLYDQRFLKVVTNTCLPPDNEEFLTYNAILQNRIHEGAHLINPVDESSFEKVFDYLCDRPFYRNEEYFAAGCEISKLLYKKTVEEIGKILDFENWSTQT